MKRNYVLRLSFLTIFALSLNSCRTDDFQSETAQQPNTNTKIKAFRDFEKKALAAKGAAPESYAYPFAETFDGILTEHPDYAAKFSDVFGEVDFKVASQTFGESEKLVYFPILKEGKLAYILSCAINAKRTEACYKILDPELKEYQVIYSTFAAYYKNRPATTAKISEGYIEEVVIEWSDPIPWWWYMIYGGATSPIGFPTPNTGGTINIPDPQPHPIGGADNLGEFPCDKIKIQVNKYNGLKTRLQNLATTTSQTVENGFYIDNTATASTANPAHTFPTGSAGELNIDTTPVNPYQVIAHTHNSPASNTYSVPSLSDMISISDLGTNGHTTQNFTFYTITADGTRYAMIINDPSTLTGFFYNPLVEGYNQDRADAYWKVVSGYYYGTEDKKPLIQEDSNSNENDIKYFLQFLKDANLDISILEIDNMFSSFKSITLDSNGNVNKQNCN